MTDNLQLLINVLLRELSPVEAAEMRQAFPEPLRLFRALRNLRPPRPIPEGFCELQDQVLSAERETKGVVDGTALPATAADPRLCLWQGDITRLKVDAIVNAANGTLLGCFIPLHGCIDNAIHSAAGIQLRDECYRLLQRHSEPTGSARMTGAYNLPCRYVLHTVGPIIQDTVRPRHRRLLASCYQSCLDLASKKGLESVAFCCISTGEFHFPNGEAAEIAVGTVRDFLNNEETSIRRVIFNVFKDADHEIYRSLLGPDTKEGEGA